MRIRKRPRGELQENANAEDLQPPTLTCSHQLISTGPRPADQFHNSEVNRSEDQRQAAAPGVAGSAPSDGGRPDRVGVISPNSEQDGLEAVVRAVEGQNDAGSSGYSRRLRKNPWPQRHRAVDEELEIVTEVKDDVMDESNFNSNQNLNEEEGSTGSCS